MWMRILALLVLVSVVAGGVWYVFRDTPEDKVRRWRQASDYLLRYTDDLEAAEQFNEKVLRYVPTSLRDQLSRAAINVRKGSVEGLETALEVYRKLSDRPEPVVQAWAATRMVRVCQLLGRYAEGRAIALSFRGTAPFVMSRALGDLESAALNLDAARRHYRMALERYATSDREKAIARMDLARVLHRIAEYGPLLSGIRPAADGDEEPSVPDGAELREGYVQLLDEAQDTLVRELRTKPGDARSLFVLVELLDRRLQQAGATPVSLSTVGGHRYLDSLLERHSGTARRTLSLELGLLYISALSEATRSGAATAPDARQLAESAREHLLLALGGASAAGSEGEPGGASSARSVEGARALLEYRPTLVVSGADRVEPDSTLEARRRYLSSLSRISERILRERSERVVLLLLGSAVAGGDPSGDPVAALEPLALGDRLRDAASSEVTADPMLSGGFGVYLGLASAVLGRTDEASRWFDAQATAYSEEPALAEEARLGVAEACFRLVGASDLALRYERAVGDAVSGDLRLLERRVRLLLEVASKDAGETSERARARLDALLDEAAETSTSVVAVRRAADLLGRLRGVEVALGILRRGIERFPDDQSLANRLTSILERRSAAMRETAARLRRQAEDGSPGDAAGGADDGRPEGGGERTAEELIARAEELEATLPTLDGEVLRLHLGTFLRRPAGSDEVVRAVTRLLSRLDGDRAIAEVQAVIAARFPGASEADGSALARAIVSFFTLDVTRALAQLDSLTSPDSLAPFVHFLRGSVFVQRLAKTRQPLVGDIPADAEHAMDADLDAAEAAFARGGEDPACRLSGLLVRLGRLPPAEDVPDELLREIREVALLDDLDHMGYWLLARARLHRFRVRYAVETIADSEVVGLVRGVRRALRRVIQRSPTHAQAYHRLAEALVICSELDDRMRASGGGYPRGIEPADWGSAIRTLSTVPNPGRETISRLVGYLQRAGRPSEAIAPLATLFVTGPNEETLDALLGTYLRADERDGLTGLLAEHAALGKLQTEGRAGPELAREWLVATEPWLLDFARLALLGRGRQPSRILSMIEACRTAEVEVVTPDATEQISDPSEREEAIASRGLLEMRALALRRVVVFLWRLALDESQWLAPYFEVRSRVFEKPFDVLTRREQREVILRLVDAWRLLAEAGRAEDPAGWNSSIIRFVNDYAWYRLEAEANEALADDEIEGPRPLDVVRKAVARVEESRSKASGAGRDPRESHGDLYDTLGWALFRAKDLDAAREEFRKLVAVRPEPLFRLHYAEVLLHAGRFEDARTEAKAAAERTEDSELRLKANRLIVEIESGR